MPTSSPYAIEPGRYSLGDIELPRSGEDAAARFLVKDLHLDWQRGATWFLSHLIDGDLASNQHGWQWTAGTGSDAAPYLRGSSTP